MPISLLNDVMINQIAAGEVIEDSASVIKELVENALDAGGTKIVIETTDNTIKIMDDGCGMSREDLLLSVKRHATSKVSKMEDLNALQTLGFRGEALPSIASVSKFSIHTCRDGVGEKLFIEGGKITSVEPVPRQRGTTVEVKNLFYNVPVRKKFQKSRSAKTAEIHKTLTKIALCNPTQGFCWIHQNQEQFDLERDQPLLERIKSLLGEVFADELLPIDGKHLSGFISRPTAHRPNRVGQHLFINGRAVYSFAISGMVQAAYATRLPPNRHPLFILDLSLPPEWIDVNVHPQKKEVRLREETKIAEYIAQGVERALNTPVNRVLHLPERPATIMEFPEAWICAEPQAPYFPESTKEPRLFDHKRCVLSKIGPYLLVQDEHQLYVIDSVAARRAFITKQLFAVEGKKSVQTLLLPIQIEFFGAERLLLMEKLHRLNEVGISIRHFGGETFLIDALPTSLEGNEVEELIRIYIQSGGLKLPIAKVVTRGVKTAEEGEALVQQLFSYPEMDQTSFVYQLDEDLFAKLFKN